MDKNGFCRVLMCALAGLVATPWVAGANTTADVPSKKRHSAVVRSNRFIKNKCFPSWSKQRMPLRVYICHDGTHKPIDARYDQIFVGATREWSAATRGRIRFVTVNGPTRADIVVHWTPDRRTWGRGQDANETCSGMTEVHWSRRFGITKASIFILTNKGDPPGLAQIKHTSLHELGHALGLAHSSYPLDTMNPTFWWDSNSKAADVSLTEGDIAALNRLYASPYPTRPIPSPVVLGPSSPTHCAHRVWGNLANL